MASPNWISRKQEKEYLGEEVEPKDVGIAIGSGIDVNAESPKAYRVRDVKLNGKQLIIPVKWLF